MEIVEHSTTLEVIHNGGKWYRGYDHYKKHIIWNHFNTNHTVMYKYFDNFWHRKIVGNFRRINYVPDVELEYQKLLRAEKLNRILDKDF